MPLITDENALVHITVTDIENGVYKHVTEFDKNNWNSVSTTVSANSGIWNEGGGGGGPGSGQEITILQKISETIPPANSGFIIDVTDLDIVENKYYDFKCFIKGIPENLNTELYIFVDSNGDGVIDTDMTNYMQSHYYIDNDSLISLHNENSSLISLTTPDTNSIIDFKIFLDIDNNLRIISESITDITSNAPNPMTVNITKSGVTNITKLRLCFGIPSNQNDNTFNFTPDSYIEAWTEKKTMIGDVEFPPLSSDMWNSNYTTVEVNSGNWGGEMPPISSDMWNSNYTTVEVNSGNWNSTSDTVDDNSNDWNSTYTLVAGNSGNWEAASTTVTNNKDKWNSTSDTVVYNSSHWDSTYTTVINNRDLWEDKSGTVEKIITSGDIELPPVSAGVSFNVVKTSDHNISRITAINSDIDYFTDGLATGYEQTSFTIVPTEQNNTYIIVNFKGLLYAYNTSFIWDASVSTDVINNLGGYSAHNGANPVMVNIPSDPGQVLPTYRHNYEYYSDDWHKFEHSFNLKNSHFKYTDNGYENYDMIPGKVPYVQFGVEFIDTYTEAGTGTIFFTSGDADAVNNTPSGYVHLYFDIQDNNDIYFKFKVNYDGTDIIDFNNQVTDLSYFKHYTIIKEEVDSIHDKTSLYYYDEIISETTHNKNIYDVKYGDCILEVDNTEMYLGYYQANLSPNISDINNHMISFKRKSYWRR